MENNKLRIRISINNSDESSISRESFWKLINSRAEKNENIPTNLEYVFRNNFPKQLKEDLQEKFRDELREFEKNYEIDLKRPYLDEIFHFAFREKYERLYFNDFINGIAKLQELKNEYFKENKEYQELLNKNLLASQIDFGVSNISYSSLGFDLSVEPIEKVIKLFDNNFEYFCLFLSAYIPESFLSSLSIYNGNDLTVSASIDSPNRLKSKFEKSEKISHHPQHIQVNGNPTSKWDKAKWIWSLANGTLLIPVILALIILYIAFNKFEDYNDIHRKNYEMIQVENDKLMQNYHRLIEMQKSVYDDVIEKNKTNNIKK